MANNWITWKWHDVKKSLQSYIRKIFPKDNVPMTKIVQHVHYDVKSNLDFWRKRSEILLICWVNFFRQYKYFFPFTYMIFYQRLLCLGHLSTFFYFCFGGWYVTIHVTLHRFVLLYDMMRFLSLCFLHFWTSFAEFKCV